MFSRPHNNVSIPTEFMHTDTHSAAPHSSSSKAVPETQTVRRAAAPDRTRAAPKGFILSRFTKAATAVLLTLTLFLLVATEAAALVYDLVAYDPGSGKRIVSGTITTDGTLGSGLDPTAIITNYSATLEDGPTTTAIDFATNGLGFSGGTVTATATELTLDAGTSGFWCLSSTCGPPNGVFYEDFSFAPTEMNVGVYVAGPGESQGLVGSRVIAMVVPPPPVPTVGGWGAIVLCAALVAIAARFGRRRPSPAS
jgi:hypothetical protein